MENLIYTEETIKRTFWAFVPNESRDTCDLYIPSAYTDVYSGYSNKYAEKDFWICLFSTAQELYDSLFYSEGLLTVPNEYGRYCLMYQYQTFSNLYLIYQHCPYTRKTQAQIII